MNKILYISYDGMTDPLGQAQVLPYLVGLSKKGHSIHLISFEKKDRFDSLKEEILSICKTNNIEWYPQNYTKNPPLLSTLFDVRTLKKLAFKLQKTHNFDWVHCRSYISAIVGLQLKEKFKCKFLFDMRGFWADERVDGRIWNIENPIFKKVYSYFKNKEKQFLFHADAIVSLTEKAKIEICSWKLSDEIPNKITVIPCCVDLQLFKYEKQEVKTSNVFTLGYIGSLGTWYMLEEMLEFYKTLLIEHPSAEFHFATKDSAKTILDLATEKELDVSKIKIVSLKHSEVPKFAASLDASVLFIIPAYSKMASCPTKLGELMAMGVPVIANNGVGDTASIIEKYHAGCLVSSFDELAYQKAMNDLSDFSLEQSILGASEVFSLEKGIASYDSIYQNKG